MKRYYVHSMLAVGLLTAGPAAGQTAANTSVVPRLIKFSGTATDARGNAATGVTGIQFALYTEETGGAPLWMETQKVEAGPGGHYTVLLGATKPGGLPSELFVSEQAHWLGVAIEGQAEQPRALLVSAPYALKAGDAETLGGLPPSAFMLAAPVAPAGTNAEEAHDVSPDTACTHITSDGTATANQVSKFSAACAIEPSAIFESGGKVGIGTTTPAANLDVKGTALLRSTLTMNAQGAATGAAGADSNPLDLLAASFSSSTSTSINQHFRWQAEAAGNDTANPLGTLNLLYAPGSGTPAETGLAVNSHGLFTFATGQTFPGVGTITGVTAGTGLTGGGTGGNITLANTGVLAVAGGTGVTSSGGNSPSVSLNTGYTDGRYLQLPGGMLSGTLSLPANGLTTANNQLALAGGSVAIGTATPGAPLEVAGTVKISGAGSALIFPDGTTQRTAGNSAGSVGVNPRQVALLKWFPAYQSVTFPVGKAPVGVAFDGTNIWVANEGSANLTELQASTGAVLATTELVQPAQPFGLAFDGATIWVADYLYDVDYVQDSSGYQLGLLTIGGAPSGIASDGTNIWATNHTGNTVTKIVPSTLAFQAYSVGSQPYAIAFDGTSIWVTNEGDDTVTRLLASSGACLGDCTFGVGTSPVGIAFDGSNIWVANYGSNTVTKLLASTGAVVGTYDVGSQPYGLAFDGANIWVTNSGSNTVTKLQASSGQVLGTFSVGTIPLGIAFDGANMWVANNGDNTVSKL